MANLRVKAVVGTKAETPPPAEGSVRPAAVTPDAPGPCKCTVCPQQFNNLQECLKHELLEHSTKNKRPQKSLRSKLHAILKSFGEDDKQTLRAQLSQALKECAAGQELRAIFKFHRMNVENLELVYARIRNCLEKELASLGSFQIHPFGSVASGLALKDSDIDLYVECNAPTQLSNQQVFNRINNLLHRSRCFEDIIPIRQARVPIIKCKHTPTGFSLDINLSCPSSVNNTNFLRDLMLLDVRLHELMLFLKVWAKQLQLIGRSNLTSYCLITLVIFYLQQPRTDGAAILPAIRDLQADLPPQLVLGVNYAYDLGPLKIQPLPQQLTALELVRGFFEFWQKFAFEELIVAPYLGVGVPLKEFVWGTYKYTAYENQLRAINILQAGSRPLAEPLHTDRCMCVQDPFCLNHNVAKSMAPPNLEYFRKCCTHAHRICTDARGSTAELYEALLYGVVEELARTAELENSVGQSIYSNQPNTLSYRFTPCRAELRAIATHAQIADNEELHKLWVQHYSEAIEEIIAEVYCLDMQSAPLTHSDKHQRLELKDTDHSHTWLLSGSVDLWTGRQHQRINNQTFMQYQRAQTAAFKRDRRQHAAYAVQLNGVLTLNVLHNNQSIELTVTQKCSANAGLAKKDPLRKFFAMFKSSMQSFNLKEKLQATSAAAKKVKLEKAAAEPQSEAALPANKAQTDTQEAVT